MIKYYHNNISLLMAIFSEERNATYKQIVKEIDIKASFPRFNIEFLIRDNISEKSHKSSHKTLANNSNQLGAMTAYF